MTKPPLDPRKIVAFTGAGISAPSGLGTFRDQNGLWARYRLEDVATPEAWRRQPEVVLNFYNERRAQAKEAMPNPGHEALAALQEKFEVVIVTQNVDDLHERAGSKRVIHVHGELTKARSSADPSLIIKIGGNPIKMGDLCAQGSQLRPHIVWFGEEVFGLEEAAEEIGSAGKFLVIGTSLTVFPAAGLLKFAGNAEEKYLIDLQPDSRPYGFKVLKGSVVELLPSLVDGWLKEV